MLTRLKVSGFKNLVDVDVRFGPFTCIAGGNGVGKSNLFDAIRFLSALAEKSLVEAALSVRSKGGRASDLRSIFHRVGDDYATRMSFEAEMIVPQIGYDDAGQTAQAASTFLNYKLTIGYRDEDERRFQSPLEILEEELTHITLSNAYKHLLFPHTAATWRKSAIHNKRDVPYISTDKESDSTIIRSHQDGGSSGKPIRRSAATLPRTVLSIANATESPTALLARREMQSWRLLQLEPSALREPDEFSSSTQLGADGSHLAANLYHLARTHALRISPDGTEEYDEAQIYTEVANRLSLLINDVRTVSIDRDERRELLTLLVEGRDHTAHPARALSDGTLRFLALTILSLDPEAQGVLCLEEPENGIHPARIPAMLQLLQDIAVDVEDAIGTDNPLRQVIINTHSPAVVQQIPDDSLLVAELKEMIQDGKQFKGVCFSSLSDTWRASAPDAGESVTRAKLLAYLNPVLPLQSAETENGHQNGSASKQFGVKTRRVIDRPDLQQFLIFPSEQE